MKETINYIAVRGDQPGYALLSDEVVQQWTKIEDSARARWKTGDPIQKENANELSGCLEKLGASLLQAHRLRLHHDNLLVQAKQLPPQQSAMLAVKGDEACADFENLILQGRATLDRLAWFVGRRLKHTVGSYTSARPLLERLSRKNSDAAKLYEITQKADGWFSGVFGQLDKDAQSLRDLVAHTRWVGEGVRTCFGINRTTSPGTVLILDCEIAFPRLTKTIPIFKTVSNSIQWLSYLVLNTAAVFLGGDILSSELYESTWKIKTVVLSDFIIKTAATPADGYLLKSIRQMTLDGFNFGWDTVNPNILAHAILLTSDEKVI